MFLLDQSFWRIENTQNKGRGVFTQKEISPGVIIGDYLGKITLDSELPRLEKGQGLYSMTYTNRTSVFPKIDSIGVHLINHSCMPNCAMFVIHNHTLIYSLRKIFTGEEITYSYQVSPLDHYHTSDLACFCNSIKCNGTMCTSLTKIKLVEHYFLKNYGDYYQSQDVISPGNSLTPLAVYPRFIPDIPVYDIYSNLNKKPLEHIDDNLSDKMTLRKMIRESGRTQSYVIPGFKVWGIAGNMLCSSQ